jgi:50S ribosomal protein L16 3-hydroxylase
MTPDFSQIRWPEGLDTQRFLADYWQKKPLLIRQAFPGFESPLSADELGGLATEAEIASRIVIEQGETPWQLRHGPFTAADWVRDAGHCWFLMSKSICLIFRPGSSLFALFPIGASMI